jgi:hypothetical protein
MNTCSPHVKYRLLVLAVCLVSKLAINIVEHALPPKWCVIRLSISLGDKMIRVRRVSSAVRVQKLSSHPYVLRVSGRRPPTADRSPRPGRRALTLDEQLQASLNVRSGIQSRNCTRHENDCVKCCAVWPCLRRNVGSFGGRIGTARTA